MGSFDFDSFPALQVGLTLNAGGVLNVQGQDLEGKTHHFRVDVTPAAEVVSVHGFRFSSRVQSLVFRYVIFHC